MKSNYIILTIFSVAVIVVGCKPADNPPRPDESVAGEFEQVKKETKEAAYAAKEYAYSQKAEFVETMKVEIEQMKVEMNKLGERIEASTGPAKEEAKIKLQTLREKADELNNRLESVNNATESTWEDVKSGVKKGYAELRDSLHQAREWFAGQSPS